MKKIFLVSLIMIASTLMTFCSSEDISTESQHTKIRTSDAQLTESQNDPKTIPPAGN